MTECVFTILIQVATYKILGRQTPFLTEINSLFAKYRSANFQFAYSQAQTKSLCYISGNLGYPNQLDKLPTCQFQEFQCHQGMSLYIRMNAILRCP